MWGGCWEGCEAGDSRATVYTSERGGCEAERGGCEAGGECVLCTNTIVGGYGACQRRDNVIHVYTCRDPAPPSTSVYPTC